MEGRRRNAVGSLLGATILLGTLGAGVGARAGPPAGPGDDAGTQALTTQATVDRAKDLSDQAAAKAATASAAAAAADPGNVDKAGDRRRRRRRLRAARPRTRTRKPTSLAGVNGGIASDAGQDAADRRRTSAGQQARSRATTCSGSRTRAACPPAPTRARNGNYAGATFMHFENLGYDFLLGDGTGGLSIWSLKNPEKPTVRRRASPPPR